MNVSAARTNLTGLEVCNRRARLSVTCRACYHCGARFGTHRATPVGRASRVPARPETKGRDFMRKALWLMAVAALGQIAQLRPDGAMAQTHTTLDIYVVDVEGGNATLLVGPSGESLLIDTGNVAPAAAIRDAERIMAAVKDAGLTRID